MASGGASPATSILDGVGPSTSLHGLSKLNPNNILNTSNDENLAPSAAANGTPKVKICVFCGASPGKSPAHMEAARSLAHAFHKNNISLVYGGGTVGLMGEVAKTLVSLSGPTSVHGVIPAPLVKYERGPDSTITNDPSFLPDYNVYGGTTVVKDMHTRKQMMAQEVLAGGEGSGFIALSGGYGTLEELMEVVTWNQLGIHNRGVVVYNVEGYWDGLINWVKGSVTAGFVGELNEGIIREAKTAEECVEGLKTYQNAEGRFKLEWGNE
ncbi:related to Rossmann fold nucleotide-binding protein [Phialocephala subalpina]|uniref:Related to Rossmann fold nucleotide-binding protein n=1 Tax=Phialocephala subalpina TaxID=576137 RepID=A0A1L7X568_9HELO|nr:related to Rossmann fold nucleotide-binding protein [Phialocephala subalpina]